METHSSCKAKWDCWILSPQPWPDKHMQCIIAACATFCSCPAPFFLLSSALFLSLLLLQLFVLCYLWLFFAGCVTCLYSMLDQDIMNKSDNKAKSEADHVKTQERKDGVVLELEQLSNYNAQLHTSCDFAVPLASGNGEQCAQPWSVLCLRIHSWCVECQSSHCKPLAPRRCVSILRSEKKVT